MEKSIYSEEYAVFLKHLRAARKKAGLTQTALARRLGQTQSFVSKIERGERRLQNSTHSRHGKSMRHHCEG